MCGLPAHTMSSIPERFLNEINTEHIDQRSDDHDG